MWDGTSAWHFVTLPKKVGDEVRETSGLRPRRGFGSMRVEVKVKESSWLTSIFPESKSGSYVLPVKKSVRLKEDLIAGDSLKITITVIG